MPAVTTPVAIEATSGASGNLTVDDNAEMKPEIFEAISYTVLMIAAMVANIFAISTILRTRSLRKNNHNLLILNLNIMDLGITLFSMTFSIGSFFDDGAFLINNYALCRFNGFFAMTFTVGNFTTTLCIAVDRYLTVVCSTRYPPNRRRVLILLAYSWIVALFFSSMPTFELLAKFVYTPATHHCSPSWEVCGYYIAWFYNIYGFTVPIMIICYFFVFRVIRQKEHRLRQYDLKNSGSGAAIQGSSSAGSLGGRFLDDGMKDSDIPSASYDSATDSDADGIRMKTVVRSLNSANSFGVPHLTSPREPSSSGVYSQEASTTNAASETKGATSDEGMVKETKRGGQFSQNLRKEGGVKWSLGNGNSSGAELDSDDQGLSEAKISSSAEKKKKKKARRLKSKKQKLSVDKQVALTGVMLVLTTVICWTPYNIIHSCFLDINLGHPIDSLSMWLGYLNALLDPLIYTFMNRKARAAGSERTRNIRNTLAGISDRFVDGLERTFSALFRRG